MIILSTFNFDRNGPVKFYTSFLGIIWTINVVRFPTHELTLGRTQKFILLPWYKGVGGGWMDLLPRVFDMLQYFETILPSLIFLTR